MTAMNVYPYIYLSLTQCILMNYFVFNSAIFTFLVILVQPLLDCDQQILPAVINLLQNR